jgi:FkbM family methyltransferase
LLSKKIKKLISLLSLTNLELLRISRIQRNTRFVTKILGHPLQVVDSMSFIGQYRDIIKRNSYAFKTESNEPFIIDCGANIGLSIIRHKMNHPGAKIISFEADPDIYKILKKNIEAFQIHDVILEQAAIWVSDGEVSFHQGGSANGKISNSSNDKVIYTKSLDLRRYLDRPVQLLKIDIEGGETVLLDHIKDCLINVDRIFIEYHSSADSSQSLQKILEILHQGNFRYYIESADVFSYEPLIYRNQLDGFDNLISIWAYKK